LTNKRCIEKSQLRHISYCRRSQSRVQSRKKACSKCTKAKTHCDLDFPSCSKCTAKNLICVYERPPISKPVAVAPLNPSADQVIISSTLEPAASTIDFASELAVYEHGYDSYPPQNVVTGSMQLDFSDRGRWSLGGTTSTYPLSTDFVYLENTFPPSPIQYPRNSPKVSNFQHHNPPFPNPFDNFNTPSIFTQPSLKAPKAFWQRSIGASQYSLNINYVLATLRSYPSKFIPGKSLPPFIHPKYKDDICKDDRMPREPFPRPLATCAAILQMCTVKNKNNTLFIWQGIRMEQERLSEEVRFSIHSKLFTFAKMINDNLCCSARKWMMGIL